jgi:hypothetical protein
MNMSDRANYTSYCGKGVAEPLGNDLVIQDLQQKLLQAETKLTIAVEALEFICEPLSTGEHIIAENALAEINRGK